MGSNLGVGGRTLGLFQLDQVGPIFHNESEKTLDNCCNKTTAVSTVYNFYLYLALQNDYHNKLIEKMLK